MALLVFPTWRFPFQSKDFDIEQALLSGGTALNGVDDTIASDGGGKWYADLGDALYSRDRVMLWRAFKSAIQYGALPFVFPVCDARHQPTMGRKWVPHSDGSPFSDDTLYASGDCTASLAADAALRATQITINMVLGKPLIGGERFAIDHPTMRHRCYQVGRIFDQTPTSATFQFHTPLREAAPAGTVIDFNSPRCVVRLSGAMSAPLAGPRWASGSVRFVEDFTGNYS